MTKTSTGRLLEPGRFRAISPRREETQGMFVALNELRRELLKFERTMVLFSLMELVPREANESIPAYLERCKQIELCGQVINA